MDFNRKKRAKRKTFQPQNPRFFTILVFNIERFISNRSKHKNEHLADELQEGALPVALRPADADERPESGTPAGPVDP